MHGAMGKTEDIADLAATAPREAVPNLVRHEELENVGIILSTIHP